MTRHTRRNIIGDIATFFLALLINLLAIAAVVLVEGHQSNWGKKFDFEWDDVIRRTFLAVVASAFQASFIWACLEG